MRSTRKQQRTNNKQQAANETSRSSSSSSSSTGVSVLERFSRASTETVRLRDRRPEGEGVRARAASDSFTDITHMHKKEHSRHEQKCVLLSCGVCVCVCVLRPCGGVGCLFAVGVGAVIRSSSSGIELGDDTRKGGEVSRAAEDGRKAIGVNLHSAQPSMAPTQCSRQQVDTKQEKHIYLSISIYICILYISIYKDRERKTKKRRREKHRLAVAARRASSNSCTT